MLALQKHTVFNIQENMDCQANPEGGDKKQVCFILYYEIIQDL